MARLLLKRKRWGYDQIRAVVAILLKQKEQEKKDPQGRERVSQRMVSIFTKCLDVTLDNWKRRSQDTTLIFNKTISENWNTVIHDCIFGRTFKPGNRRRTANSEAAKSFHRLLVLQTVISQKNNNTAPPGPPRPYNYKVEPCPRE